MQNSNVMVLADSNIESANECILKGNALLEMGRLKGAADQFREALGLHVSERAYYKLGVTCYLLKDHTAARKYFDDVLKTIPDHYAAKRYLRVIDSVTNMSDVTPATVDKYCAELRYWKNRWEQEDGELGNSHYEKLMLAMAGENDQSFLERKVVADLGCGPRGSLCWATAAGCRIGIDVLADEYAQLGIRSHNMSYVCSTENSIPLPSNYVDLLFTVNAMDHMSNFETMCKEAYRIMAPGALFVGSFNLGEPPTKCEPLTLTEEIVEQCLLNNLKVLSFRVAPVSTPPQGSYIHFFDGSPAVSSGPRHLWVKAGKAK